jgi:cytochrome P450
LPLLGETLALLKDPFGFVESRARRLGPVFRTRVLGRPTAVITGPDATAKFIDANDVQRAHAMPGNIQTLFGGRTLPVLDGDEHRARKQVIMAAFTHEAIAGYVPPLAGMVHATLTRWAAAGEVRAVDELRRTAIEAIALTILGQQPGPALDGLRAEYAAILRGFQALPLPLPGTTYSRAKAAIGRALEALRAEVLRHEAAPGPATDGLGRILAARGQDGGAQLDADEIARELHHLVLAGLVVWAWCARALVELAAHPEVAARLKGELATLPPGAPTFEALAILPYLDQVAREIRRITPVVPVGFGRARRTFTLAGHTIPAGWMVLWGTTASHARPEVYPAPERFDPGRFAAGTDAGRPPHAFAPNGAGDAVHGHKCAGYELAPTLLKVFVAELVRGFSFTLAAGQDLDYDWSVAPPAPKDGLRVTVTARG